MAQNSKEKRFWDYGSLRPSEKGPYFTVGEKPFFWLGDTAWLLFQKLELEDAALYLKNRKEKNFNVIQATLVHTLNINSVHYTDPYDPAYWDHCDAIIKIAEELGLYMALLPCWGSFAKGGDLTAEKALAYADFLHKRYQNQKNIIWVIGGDVRGDDAFDVFCTFGRRMRELFPDTLIGYHPFGRTSSSYWFHKESWIDFHMFQSGHRRYDQKKLGNWDDSANSWPYYGEDNWKYVDHDLSLEAPKPTLDGEPSYEWILQGLHDSKEPYWMAPDVRRYAYWSVFEGAAGHTYGHNSIMQFFEPGQDPSTGSFGNLFTWQEAIHHEAGSQMSILYQLMTSADFTQGRPACELLTDGQKEAYHRISILKGPDYLYCYDYLGESFRLDLSFLGEKTAEAYWLDPASGIQSYLGSVKADPAAGFTPVKKYSAGNDWVLVLRWE